LQSEIQRASGMESRLEELSILARHLTASGQLQPDFKPFRVCPFESETKPRGCTCRLRLLLLAIPSRLAEEVGFAGPNFILFHTSFKR